MTAKSSQKSNLSKSIVTDFTKEDKNKASLTIPLPEYRSEIKFDNDHMSILLSNT